MENIILADKNESVRRKLRLSLEIEDFHVLEAGSLSQLRHVAFSTGPSIGSISALLIDPVFDDGDGTQLISEFLTQWPDARIAYMHNPGVQLDGRGIPTVNKTDVDKVISSIRSVIDIRPDSSMAFVKMLQSEMDQIANDWQELVRWDPMLPYDVEVPDSPAFLAGIIDAIGRAQPLGWGTDPIVEKVAIDFVEETGQVEVAVGQLICLREAIRRRVMGRVPSEIETETMNRVHMIIDRAIGLAAYRTTEKLREQAHVDALTGLLNRRALVRDLQREIGRASRHHRIFSVMAIDVDGLKRVNDSKGHGAGDDLLCRLADSLRAAMRVDDSAYRLGGDEFALVLIETDDERARIVAERIKQSGAPEFSWGAVTYPNDSSDMNELLEIADSRLYEQRRLVRGTTERIG